MKNIFLLLFFSILITSCFSNVRRPQLTGTIIDEEGNPIDSCAVGETYTDKNGGFVLVEKINNGFFNFLGGPPVNISEQIRKTGYEPKELAGRGSRGGIRKGSVWDMDTIRLRKEITDFSRIKLKDHWLASMTKQLDTVFMTRKGQEYDVTKIDRIAGALNTYARGYYYLGIDNLPENVFERHIELDLTDTILKLQRVLIYRDPVSSEKKKYDTIYTKGKWKQKQKVLYFETDLAEINGTYKVVKFNYDSMKLVKQ